MSTITISESVYSENVWSVVATVDGPTGTFVGPFIIDLPEDATDDELIAAIRTIVGD